MAVSTWSYGGLEVSVQREPERVGALAMVLCILGLIVAPLALTGWALVHWFPVSLPVMVALTVVMWTAMYLTADELDDPLMEVRQQELRLDQ
jgi:CHASE2 domain-containing sensor protein